MTYKETLVALAEAYADACDQVQPAWEAMMATKPSSAERIQTRKLYVQASQRAAFARLDLVRHASRGKSEVGL